MIIYHKGDMAIKIKFVLFDRTFKITPAFTDFSYFPPFLKYFYENNELSAFSAWISF
jgi:hypothetical protein